MRSGRPRSRAITGIALLAIAALLFLAGLGAALSERPAATETLRAAPETDAGSVGGIALHAGIELNALGLHVEREFDVDPPAARDASLPGFSAERRERLAPQQLPIDADLDLALQAGSHLQRDGEAGATTSTQAQLTEAVTSPTTLTLAAAALAGAGFLTLAWGSLKTVGQKLLVFPAVALYAKISRSEVFENEVRERIFAAIRERPGIAATDLARLTRVAWGTTIYHLEVLEQTRMVTSLRQGRHRRYFLNGAPLEQTKQALGVLHNTVTSQVAQRIHGAPGVTQKDLAAATGMTPQALHWHLVRLVDAGLIRKEREGRVVRHFPNAG